MVAGRAALTTVLVGGAETGLVLAETGSLTLDYTTVASSRNGPGIDNSAQGYFTARLSILYGNAGNDLVGVQCHLIQQSVVGSPGCQIYWSSFEDPLLDADYVPQTGSSALERGRDAVTYSDSPCIDLAGGCCGLSPVPLLFRDPRIRPLRDLHRLPRPRSDRPEVRRKLRAASG